MSVPVVGMSVTSRVYIDIRDDNPAGEIYVALSYDSYFDKKITCQLTQIDGRDAGKIVSKVVYSAHYMGRDKIVFDELSPGATFQCQCRVQDANNHIVYENTIDHTIHYEFTGSFDLSVSSTSSGVVTVNVRNVECTCPYIDMHLEASKIVDGQVVQDAYADKVMDGETSWTAHLSRATGEFGPRGMPLRDGECLVINAWLKTDTGSQMERKTVQHNVAFVNTGHIVASALFGDIITASLDGLPSTAWYYRRVAWTVLDRDGRTVATNTDHISENESRSTVKRSWNGLNPHETYTIKATISGYVYTGTQYSYLHIGDYETTATTFRASGEYEVLSTSRTKVSTRLSSLDGSRSSSRVVKWFYRKASESQWTVDETSVLVDAQTVITHDFSNLLPSTAYSFKAIICDRESGIEADSWTVSAVTEDPDYKYDSSDDESTRDSLTLHYTDRRGKAIRLRISAKQTHPVGRLIRLTMRKLGSTDWITLKNKTIGANVAFDPLFLTVQNLQTDTMYEFQAVMIISGVTTERRYIRVATTSEDVLKKPEIVSAVASPGITSEIHMNMRTPEDEAHTIQISRDGITWGDIRVIEEGDDPQNYTITLTAAEKDAMSPDADGNFPFYLRVKATATGMEPVYSDAWRGIHVAIVPPLLNGEGELIAKGDPALIDDVSWNSMTEALREILWHDQTLSWAVFPLVNEGDEVSMEALAAFSAAYSEHFDTQFPSSRKVEAAELLEAASSIREDLTNIIGEVIE